MYNAFWIENEINISHWEKKYENDNELKAKLILTCRIYKEHFFLKKHIKLHQQYMTAYNKLWIVIMKLSPFVLYHTCLKGDNLLMFHIVQCSMDIKYSRFKKRWYTCI